MSITDMPERFKQEEAAANERAKQIQNDALERLKSACEQQCNAAESTLKDALEASLKSIQSAISENTSAMNQQLVAVNKDVKGWTPKLLKTIKLGVLWPSLATALVCAGMMVGSFAWWKIQNREYVHLGPFITDQGKTMMIVDEPTWEYCNEPEVPDKATGKKVVHQQRCRRAD